MLDSVSKTTLDFGGNNENGIGQLLSIVICELGNRNWYGLRRPNKLVWTSICLGERVGVRVAVKFLSLSVLFQFIVETLLVQR